MNQQGLSGVKAIVFDLEDTLYDRIEWLVPAIEHAAAKGNLDGDIAGQLAVEYIRDRGCADAGIFNHILLGMGQSDSVINIRAFLSRVNNYHAEPGSLQLQPGALEALTTLRGYYRLSVIAVGFHDLQQSKIRALGLADLVDDIIVLDDGHEKHETPVLARALTTAITRGAVRAGDTLFVADNPLKDFVSARAVGVLTVRVLTGEYAGFDYPSSRHAADYDISSVARLPELIEHNPPGRAQANYTEQDVFQPLAHANAGIDGNWPGLQSR